MGFGWGSVISGALGAGGAIFGSSQSANSANKLTQQQIAWERERAQNAHQWEVKDLQKAGINPILSAGGSGATTSGISGAMPDTSGYGKAIDAINSATTLKRTNAEIKNLDATTNKTNVESGLLTPKAEAEIREKNSATALNSAKKAESKKETEIKGHQEKLYKYGVKGAQAAAPVLGTGAMIYGALKGRPQSAKQIWKNAKKWIKKNPI